MRVVVTGAGGFVGSHIALAIDGAVGLVRTPAKAAWLEGQGVSLVGGDITDRDSLRRAFEGADAVVSNAALGSNQGDLAEMTRVNCEGVRNVLSAASEAGVKRVVHISSVAVYQTKLWHPIAEDAPQRLTDRHHFAWSDFTTDWRYAMSKTTSEQIAWQLAGELGLALTCLRPGPVYGSRDTKATAKLVAGMRGRVRLGPTVGVPWVHAGDVALATAAALANPATIGQSYNLAGAPVKQLVFLRTMRKILVERGWRRLPWIIPLPLPAWVAFDTTKAARDLGFVARDLTAGLREALAEYTR